MRTHSRRRSRCINLADQCQGVTPKLGLPKAYSSANFRGTQQRVSNSIFAAKNMVSLGPVFVCRGCIVSGLYSETPAHQPRALLPLQAQTLGAEVVGEAPPINVGEGHQVGVPSGNGPACNPGVLLNKHMASTCRLEPKSNQGYLSSTKLCRPLVCKGEAHGKRGVQNHNHSC